MSDDSDRSPGWVNRRRRRNAERFKDTYDPPPADDGGYYSDNPSPPPKKKPLCKLTSSFAFILGKTAAAPELRTMRWFRDEVMPGRDQGLLDMCFAIGPAVADSLQALDAEARLRISKIYWASITKTVAKIKEGDFGEAISTYRDAVWRVRSELAV